MLKPKINPVSEETLPSSRHLCLVLITQQQNSIIVHVFAYRLPGKIEYTRTSAVESKKASNALTLLYYFWSSARGVFSSFLCATKAQVFLGFLAERETDAETGRWMAMTIKMAGVAPLALYTLGP